MWSADFIFSTIAKICTVQQVVRLHFHCVLLTQRKQPEASSAFLKLCLIMVIITANVISCLESAPAQLNLISLHKSFSIVVLDSFLIWTVNFQGFVPSHVISPILTPCSDTEKQCCHWKIFELLRDIWTSLAIPLPEVNYKVLLCGTAFSHKQASSLTTP